MTLKLFEDKEGLKIFNMCNFIEVEVGSSKSKEAYLKNIDEKWNIVQIKESISDGDISVGNIPLQLAPQESKPIVITFKPSLNRDSGLHSDIFFTGKLVKV